MKAQLIGAEVLNLQGGTSIEKVLVLGDIAISSYDGNLVVYTKTEMFANIEVQEEIEVPDDFVAAVIAFWEADKNLKKFREVFNSLL